MFAEEPCTDSPLFELENVVATPHLGASTEEAQEKAGIAVARSVRLALSGELVPDAVNVQGGVIAEDVRPGIPLVEKLGRIFTALAGEVAQQIDVEVRGEITEHDVKVLELAALKGVFADVVEDQVSYVNAPLLAAERGTEVRLVTDPESPDHRNLITIRGTLADGSQVSVSGTLIGIAQKERLVEVNGFVVDLEPTEHLAFFTYEDRPGMVGTVGKILGDAGGQHRRHAGLARHQGRPGPGGPLGGLRRTRPRCWRRSAAPSPPTWCAGSTSPSRRGRPSTTRRSQATRLVVVREPGPGSATVSSPGAAEPGDRVGEDVGGLGVGEPHEPVEAALGGEGGPGGEEHVVPLGARDQGRGQRAGQLAPQVQAAGRAGRPPVGQVLGDRGEGSVAGGAQLFATVVEQVLAVAEQVGRHQLLEQGGTEVEGEPRPEERVHPVGRAPGSSRSAGRPRTACSGCRH